MTSFGGSGWARAALAAVALAAMVGACGDETGVLVEITRADDVPARLDRVVVFAATDIAGRDGHGYADRAPLEDLVLGDRDLASDPYRLLLRPTDGSAGAHVMVVAIAFVGDQPVGFGAIDEAARFVDGAVVQWPLLITATPPPGLEVRDDCVTWFEDDGTQIVVGRKPDADCDGFTADAGDCDDLDPLVNPGALDICDNGIDEDCDDVVDEDVDEDGDTFTTCGGDCDDRTEAVNPNATEICDGLDNDCSGACDAEFDGDGDGFTSCATKLLDGGACEANDAYLDCDDGDPDTRPFAEEVCDGVDNDCSGACDDRAELDPDRDGYTECGSRIGFCGVDSGAIDCEPEDGAIHPGAVELCNGEDDDCDGSFLQLEPCYVRDADAICHLGARECDEASDVAAVGLCAPGEQTVEDGLCDAYDACLAGDSADPFGCANREGSAAKLACDVNFQPEVGQCAEPVFTMPTGGSTTCTWQVVGGVEHGPYRVGFLDGDLGIPVAETQECAATLAVQLVEDPAPPINVVLARTDDGVTTLIELVLTPVPTSECNPPPGLSCTLP